MWRMSVSDVTLIWETETDMQYTACTALYCNAAPDCWQRRLWSPATRHSGLRTAFVQNSQFANILPAKGRQPPPEPGHCEGVSQDIFAAVDTIEDIVPQKLYQKNVTALVLFYLWFHEKLKLLGAESRSIYRGCICWGRARIKPKPTSFH